MAGRKRSIVDLSALSDDDNLALELSDDENVPSHVQIPKKTPEDWQREYLKYREIYFNTPHNERSRTPMNIKEYLYTNIQAGADYDYNPDNEVDQLLLHLKSNPPSNTLEYFAKLDKMEEEENQELNSDESSCDEQCLDKNKKLKPTNMEGDEQTLVLSPTSPKDLASPLVVLDNKKINDSTLSIDSRTAGTNDLTLVVTEPPAIAQSLICHVPHFYNDMMRNNVKDEVLKEHFLKRKDWIPDALREEIISYCPKSDAISIDDYSQDIMMDKQKFAENCSKLFPLHRTFINYKQLQDVAELFFKHWNISMKVNKKAI